MGLARIATLGLLIGLLGAPLAQAQDGCRVIQADGPWHFAYIPEPSRITSVEGSWTVDRNLAQTDWRGHQGADAERLAPFSVYKYDPAQPFGRLLIRARDGDPVYPVQVGRDGTVINPGTVEMRINDSDATLLDNAGSLNVCWEALDEPAAAPGAPASQPRPSSAPAGADRSAWMACFNDSRQADADSAALDRRRADLRTRERALERRAADLQTERNHLSYSYDRDEFGIADRARANQIRSHEQRVDAYNADLRAYNADLAAHNRQVAEYNTRNSAWRSRCGGVAFESGGQLVQEYCVGAAAGTAFCRSFQ